MGGATRGDCVEHVLPNAMAASDGSFWLFLAHRRDGPLVRGPALPRLTMTQRPILKSPYACPDLPVDRRPRRSSGTWLRLQASFSDHVVSLNSAAMYYAIAIAPKELSAKLNPLAISTGSRIGHLLGSGRKRFTQDQCLLRNFRAVKD